MIHRRTIVMGLAAFACPAFAKEQSPPPERLREIEQALEGWRLAWELGEPDMYLRFYDPQFKGYTASRKHWENQRRKRLAREKIAIKVEKLRVKMLSDTEADVRFVQHYASGGHKDVGEKRLRLRRSGGAWRITRESWKRQAP
jgi:colicin import membrane protein